MHYPDRLYSFRSGIIKDTGTGSFFGTIAGAALGSSPSRGNVLATLRGGLFGTYVGNEVNKANAQELSVDLDSGKHIVVIAQGNKFSIGQHVRIILNGGQVVLVEHN